MEEREGGGGGALRALAERAGILPEYLDQTGRQTRTTSDETRVALLAAMGVDASDERAARAAFQRFQAEEAARMLEPVSVRRSGETPERIEARLPAGAPRRVEWHAVLADEKGESLTFHGEARSESGRAIIVLPTKVEKGYHTVDLSLDIGSRAIASQQKLIVVPPRAPSVDDLAGRPGCRFFGHVANLYTVRGDRDWGVGDLRDLGELAEWCGELGGAFVGVNPLHALRNRGLDVSPYSPISRLYRNFIYVDIESVPELAESAECRALLERRDVRAAIDRARAASRIDYETVAEVKRTLLLALFRTFQHAHHDTDSARGRAFRDWVHEEGEPLRAFATFMALDEHFGSEPGGWTGWPEPYRTPSSPEVIAFAQANRGDLDFHAWVQFELDRQLGVAAERARRAGLAIGIYQDLAIGTAGWGSDVWASPQLFASGVSIGSPPDNYSAAGQDWGLPPLNPLALRASAYGHWISLLHSAFGHAGALRIDHILGLFRQFWIPHGRSGEDGAYVRFPAEDLLGILALEAERHGAVVVGEDLGTVPPEVGPALERWGLLASRVLYFERDEHGAFHSADSYPRLALATANTHDMATLEGFWQGSDIVLRRDVGLIESDAEAESARKERSHARAALIRRLVVEGVLGAHEKVDGTRLREAVHQFLGRTSSVLVGLSLDDIAGEMEPVNVPGLSQDRYPSWSRRLSRTIGELRDDAAARRIARCENRDSRLAGHEIQRAPGTVALQPHPSTPESRVQNTGPRTFRSTCRLQVNAEQALADVHRLVDYLERLGVSHLYLSPVLRARSGSTHGYDVADSSTLNPELGTDEDWRALSRELRRRGMGILLDIVPNHMGIGSENPYWTDVLTHGQAAHYAHWFDIDWEPPQRALRGRVLVPVLGDEIHEVLERDELVLAWTGDRITVRYFEHVFPIDPATAPRVLRVAAADVISDPNGAAALQQAIAAFERMPNRNRITLQGKVERYRLAEEGWLALAAAMSAHPAVRDAVTRAIGRGEFARGDAGRARLLSFLDAQAYRLSFWRRAARECNYRRFFEINELAALRMEDPTVFGERHRLLLGWIADGLIDGLRIDHVDGLYDPQGYLHRLRQAVHERLPRREQHFPIYVEKILSSGERLPGDWQVAGTTGYEFMNDLESIFIEAAGAAEVEKGYRRIIRLRSPGVDFHEVAHRGKLHLLRTALRADVSRLTSLLIPLARRNPDTATYSRAQLTEGIVEMIAALPVYRTYVTGEQETITEHDRRWIMSALERARSRGAVPEPVLQLIADVFLHHGEPEDIVAHGERLRFVMRFQQTSSPATAKGVEDTALYRYVPLASLNEVGGEPSRPLDGAVERLHEANAERAQLWPENLLAVSTHDTKRSADVRARLDVLSEIPERWLHEVASWRRRARPFRTRVRDRPAPDAAAEYLFFQNLVGIWPALDPEAFPVAVVLAEVRERMTAYALKAAREAKAQTSWTDPNKEWEQALENYIEQLFDVGVGGGGGGDARSSVLHGVAHLAREIALPGLWNALSRQLVQLTAPGVPDIFQGDELWNFSLVDPDNRRPVDWRRRERLLAELMPGQEREGGWDTSGGDAAGERELTDSIWDGRAKLYVTRVALAARFHDPRLFQTGAYLPLAVSGPHARHVFAFARVSDGSTAVTVVPRLSRTLTGGSAPPVGEGVWGETVVHLPAEFPQHLRPLCGREAAIRLESRDPRTLRVGHLLANFPVALLVSKAS